MRILQQCNGDVSLNIQSHSLAHTHISKTNTKIPTAKVMERHSISYIEPSPNSLLRSFSIPSQPSSPHHALHPRPLRRSPYRQHRPPDYSQNRPNPAVDAPSLSGRPCHSVDRYCQSDCWVSVNDATRALQMLKESHLRTRQRWHRHRRRFSRARGCRIRWLLNRLFAGYGGRGGRLVGGGRAMEGG